MVSSSKPDFLFEIEQLAQVTEIIVEERPKHYVLLLNKSSKYAVHNEKLLIPTLNMDDLLIVGFFDASPATNHDISLQFCYIILLAESSTPIVPIVYISWKAR